MMGLFSWLFKSKPQPKPEFDETISWLEANGCTDCGHFPIQLVKTTMDGLNQNMFCRTCGAKYKFTPVLDRAVRDGRDPFYEKKEQVK